MSHITIIIPVYNIEAYLAQTLDCLLAQTYKDWCCLLIDDGSTDDSVAIMDTYCSVDSRFRVLHKANEKSADLARKYAYPFVETDWVMQIDGDDLIGPGYIERMLKRQQDTDADLVVAQFVGYDDEMSTERYRIPRDDYDFSQVLAGPDVCIENFGVWLCAINGALYRKALVKDIPFGPYMNSDEFSARLLEYNAAHVAFCHVTYMYRRRVGTSSRISIRIFDRTLVDMQLEQFLLEKFPQRQDKIRAIIRQRISNLIFLAADYQRHKRELTREEQEKAVQILRTSYQAINRKLTRKVAPHRYLLLTHSFTLFYVLATIYVRCYVRPPKGKNVYK